MCDILCCTDKSPSRPLIIQKEWASRSLFHINIAIPSASGFKPAFSNSIRQVFQIGWMQKATRALVVYTCAILLYLKLGEEHTTVEKWRNMKDLKTPVPSFFWTEDTSWPGSCQRPVKVLTTVQLWPSHQSLSKKLDDLICSWQVLFHKHWRPTTRRTYGKLVRCSSQTTTHHDWP